MNRDDIIDVLQAALIFLDGGTAEQYQDKISLHHLAMGSKLVEYLKKLEIQEARA